MKDKFIRIDADSIGDKIELALLSGDPAGAQQVHNTVQNGLIALKVLLDRQEGIELLMAGSDDILFKVNIKNYDELLIENLRSLFFETTTFTISVGIGNSIQEALINLTRAKLSGRDQIVAS